MENNQKQECPGCGKDHEKVQRAVEQMTETLLHRIDPADVRTAARLFRDENSLPLTDEHADKIGLSMFTSGVHAASAVVIGTMQAYRELVIEIRDRLVDMNEKYAGTPTVLAELAPLMARMHAFSKLEIDAGFAHFHSVVTERGIRLTVATGEESIETMLDEEFAMIGERASKNPLAVLILSIRGKRDVPPERVNIELGKATVESTIKVHKIMIEESEKMLAGKPNSFCKIMDRIGSAV